MSVIALIPDLVTYESGNQNKFKNLKYSENSWKIA